MLKTLQSAAVSIKNQQLQMASTANNIANVNTVGYKTDRPADFTETLRQALHQDGITTDPTSTVPPHKGIGSRVIMLSNKDHSQGPLQETGRELDLAIEGEGFFALTDPNNPGRTLYSRAGVFHLDSRGNLHNPAGYHLAQLTLPANTKEIKITEQGQILADNQSVGQLTLTCFENPDALEPVGLNLLAANQHAVEKNANLQPGAIRQGYLELSNVDMADEVTKLITSQRAHSFSARALTTADEMWGIANSLRK